MTYILFQFGIFWLCVKAMEWKLPFYVASSLYAITYTGFLWALDSAYSGALQPLDLRFMAVQLLVGALVFYAIDRTYNTENMITPALVFVGGFLLLIVLH